MKHWLKAAGICLLIVIFAAGVWLFASGEFINHSNLFSTTGPADSGKGTGSGSGQSTEKAEGTTKEDTIMKSEQITSSFKSYPITPGVWEITDGTPDMPDFVDIYLVEGTEKALLIDAGVSGSDLSGFVKTLTSKPVELVLTHGHGDHVAAAMQFGTIYMSRKDFKPVHNLKDFESSGIQDLKGGERFDLGGCRLEVLMLPGHTPGSLLLLDRERQLLFAGDAMGSGSLWMQLEESGTVEEFRDEMRNLEKSLADLRNLTPYLGHNCLMGKKPDKEYITDTRIAAEKIVSGELIGKPSERTEFPGAVTVAFGQMTDFLYRPEKILKSK